MRKAILLACLLEGRLNWALRRVGLQLKVKTYMGLNAKSARFPCPICTEPLEVRQSKKGKPYVICDPCGVQMFVRQRGGISAFNELVERADGEDVWARLKDLAGRYRKKCPKCGREFWIEQDLVETDWMDGDFLGFRCPTRDCKKIVPWEGKNK